MEKYITAYFEESQTPLNTVQHLIDKDAYFSSCSATSMDGFGEVVLRGPVHQVMSVIGEIANHGHGGLLRVRG